MGRVKKRKATKKAPKLAAAKRSLKNGGTSTKPRQEVLQNPLPVYHVHKSNGSWVVRKHGALRVSGKYSTKQEAEDAVRAIKKNKQIVIHKANGNIERWVKLSRA